MKKFVERHSSSNRWCWYWDKHSYCVLKYKTVQYEYLFYFLLIIYVKVVYLWWLYNLKTLFENVPIFPPPLLFSPLSSVFPSPRSFLFSLFFMKSSSNTELHSPCSCPPKRVMFLLRRIPFSTRHIPARRKGWLIKPSSGLTWLWLVATWLIKLSFKILHVLFLLFKTFWSFTVFFVHYFWKT